MRTLLLIVGLCFLSAGSSCLDSQTILPGQLGVIEDATVIPCEPYPGEKNHQCLLLANPFDAALKLFDITDNQFVLSPIGYFPLVIKAGQTPSSVALINKIPYVLDPGTNSIYQISDKFKSPSLSPIQPLIFKPTQFALAKEKKTESEVAWAFVSQFGKNGVSAISLNPENSSANFNILAGLSIDKIQVDASGEYLLAVAATKLNIFKLSDLFLNKALLSPTELDLGASVNNFTAAGGKILIALAGKKLLLTDLKTLKQEASYDLDSEAYAVYLPASVPGPQATCCGTQPSWLAALTANRTLNYILYDSANKKLSKGSSVDLVEVTGMSKYAFSTPKKLLGTAVENPAESPLGDCKRRMILVYSGALLNVCEGQSNIKRIEQIVN